MLTLGFTKLFNVSDSNLDDSFAVLQMLYQKLNDCVDLVMAYVFSFNMTGLLQFLIVLVMRVTRILLGHLKLPKDQR